ncbi:MAG: inositol monophosphatase family protein, partial [Pseudomonadota bacterium]
IALSGPNLEAFDIAALIPVIEGAGGVISDWQGKGLDAASAGAVVATANPRLHDRVLTLLG